ncbi:MAG: hypothetical protein QOH39_1830 [Verrucomicrobiota bacterium]
MKVEFPGYFPISEQAIKAAWKDGLFSFDASVLLGCYRYSDDTRQELLKLIAALGDKVWITNQAALEFLDGRLGVITAQAKQYETSVGSINSIENSFKNVRGHPFLSRALAAEADTFFGKLRTYLTERKAELDLLVTKDPIQEAIVGILKGRIGGSFSEEELRKLFTDGERRYVAKVPPGYEDAKKPDGSSRFGDLMIWFQLIEKARKEKKPITFVTADGKEDWWRIWQGKTIGPRPELVAEMNAKAGVTFQMFSPERFMEVASKRLSRVVKETAIREVKEVRKAELSPSTIDILRSWEQGRLDAQMGPTGATGPYQQGLTQQELNAQLGLTGPAGLGSSAYQQMLAQQEKLNAQLGGLTGAAGLGISAYQQMIAQQDKLNAQLGGLTGAAGLGSSAFQEMLTQQEKLNAQLGPTGLAGLGSSAYQQMLAQQDKLNAQLGGLTGAAGLGSSAYQQMIAQQDKLNAQLGGLTGAPGLGSSAYKHILSQQEIPKPQSATKPKEPKTLPGEKKNRNKK